MTDSFGNKLRQARERRGISLAEIAARTKIKASLFEEVERDDASHWPAGIFRRSFMRDYAKAVGLNPEETVREFLRRFPDPADTTGGTAVRPAAATATPAVARPVPMPPQPAPASKPASAAAPQAPARPKAIGQPAPYVRQELALAPPSPVEPQAAPRPAPVAAPAAALRLTLVETGMPFMGGRVLADARQRWSAAAWDGGSLLAIALIAFVIVGSFWVSLAMAAVCYYLGGILLLGNSPGVCLFAPRPKTSGTSGVPPVRVPRPRHVEPVTARHSEPAFRARRWAAKRSELNT
ncbi:MAG: helix-turn-helix domain-containing protein [Vicinamibacterales bacterium]